VREYRKEIEKIAKDKVDRDRLVQKKMMEVYDAAQGSKADELRAKSQAYLDDLDRAQRQAEDIRNNLEAHCENAMEMRQQKVESLKPHMVHVAARRQVAHELLEQREFESLANSVENGQRRLKQSKERSKLNQKELQERFEKFHTKH